MIASIVLDVLEVLFYVVAVSIVLGVIALYTIGPISFGVGKLTRMYRIYRDAARGPMRYDEQGYRYDTEPESSVRRYVNYNAVGNRVFLLEPGTLCVGRNWRSGSLFISRRSGKRPRRVPRSLRKHGFWIPDPLLFPGEVDEIVRPDKYGIVDDPAHRPDDAWLERLREQRYQPTPP